jgi:hypothetical protein
MFSDFFPKIPPFMRYCRKIWWNQRGHMTSQYGACTRPHARVPTCTHGQACIHTPICNTLPQQLWFRERALMLRYTYTACLAINVFYKYQYSVCSTNCIAKYTGKVTRIIIRILTHSSFCTLNVCPYAAHILPKLIALHTRCSRIYLVDFKYTRLNVKDYA